jgi:hypothetical protein
MINFHARSAAAANGCNRINPLGVNQIWRFLLGKYNKKIRPHEPLCREDNMGWKLAGKNKAILVPPDKKSSGGMWQAVGDRRGAHLPIWSSVQTVFSKSRPRCVVSKFGWAGAKFERIVHMSKM